MRVIAFRHRENLFLLPTLGASVRTRPCPHPTAALPTSRGSLAAGRRGQSFLRNLRLRQCVGSRPVDFSLWGRYVRGVPVCHTRSIYPSCNTLPSPCHWWLCASLPRCPWH